MRQIIIAVLCLFVSINVSPQKVKIKKNIISIDGVDVGQVEKFKNKETKEEGYVYSDLNGENQFNMMRHKLDAQNTWFVLKPTFTKDTAEIQMEYLYFTLSEQSALTDLLAKRYKFFKTSDIDVQAIKDYVKIERDPQIEPLRQKLIAEKQKRMEVQKMFIKVLAGGVIVKGGNEEVIGKFLSPTFNEPVNAKNPIVILDEKGNELAKITEFSSSSRCIVTTYDDNMFTYEDSGFFGPNRATEFYTGVANLLALKEYLKGQPNSYVNVIVPQIEAAKAKEAALTAQEKEEYMQRTNIEGTLYMKKGESYTGRFEVLFRQTESGSIQHLSRVYDESRLGWGLVYYFLDKKDKMDTHYFRANKCLRFEVDPRYTPDNTGEIYDVVNYTILNDNSPINFDKLMPFSASETFALRIYATPKVGLYYYSGYFILKKTNKKRGFAKKKFTSTDLKEFAEDVPEVIENIKAGKYASSDKDLIQFANDYDKYSE